MLWGDNHNPTKLIAPWNVYLVNFSLSLSAIDIAVKEDGNTIGKLVKVLFWILFFIIRLLLYYYICKFKLN